MGFQIFRVAKCNHRNVIAMSKHALREVKVPNAIADAPLPVVIQGVGSTREVLARIAALKAVAIENGQRWRKDQVEAVDVLVTTSPEDMQRLTLEEQSSYFKNAVQFIAETFGGMKNILTAAIHRDETTPHMQLLVAPIDATGRFRVKAFVKYSRDLSNMQTAFHEKVARHYNLERGEIGSKAKHVPVRTYYAHAAQVTLGKAEALEDIPPAPILTWKNMFSVEYKTATEAREATITRNNGLLPAVKKERLQLRAMHPSQRAHQAKQYREVIRLNKLSEAQKVETEKRIEDAKAKVENVINEKLEEADATVKKAIFERDTAKIFASDTALEAARILGRFSQVMDKDHVAYLSEQLGIHLKPGDDLVDMVRKAGLAETTIEATALLDKAADGLLTKEVEGLGNGLTDTIRAPYSRPGAI